MSLVCNNTIKEKSMETSNKSVFYVGESDYGVAEKLVNYPVLLSQFWKVADTEISTENQNKIITMNSGGYPILVKDITVYAYCKYGNFFVNGVGRDKITVSLKHGRTDEHLMEEGLDISAFAPNKPKRITPFLLSKDSNIKIEFRHDRAVGEFAKEFPGSGQAIYQGIDMYPESNGAGEGLNGGLFTYTPFPVKLQIVFDCAKIYESKK